MKKNKETNDQKVINALDALDKAVRMLRKFGAKYDVYMDEAAMRGDDARAKQLIKQKIQVFAFAEQLNAFKSNIELGAYTSQALSMLSTLPEAIAGCKGLIAETPDFTKLGKSISTIFQEISKSEQELAELNTILNPKPAENITSRLEGTPADEAEESEQFKAEYMAMIERLKVKMVPETVSKPDSSSLSATGDIDYNGIFEEEKKKQ